MIGGILAGISVAQGIYGAVSSSNSASDQRDQAEKRARDLKEMSIKEYNLNIKETLRSYEINLHTLYKDNAEGIFAFSGEVEKAQSEILQVAQNNTMGNVSSSSFTQDADSIMQSEYLNYVGQSNDNLNYSANELTHSYNTNIDQLKLNREKMERDIQDSVGLANLYADKTQSDGISQGLTSLTDAFTTYNYWN